MAIYRWALILLLCMIQIFLFACGGGGGGGDTPQATFSVHVTVNACDGTGLILQNNGGDDLSISGNGTFTFATKLVDSTNYNVTVLTQPINPAQTCVATNNVGTVNGADVSNVTVNCFNTGISVLVAQGETDEYFIYGANVGNLNDLNNWYSVDLDPNATLLAHTSSGDDLQATGDYRFYIIASPGQIEIDSIALGATVGNYLDSWNSWSYGNLSGSNLANVYGPPDGLTVFMGLVAGSSGGTYSGFITIEKPTLSTMDDSYQAYIDDVLTIGSPGVLANDDAGTGASLELMKYDPSSVAGGTVSLALDGGFTYTPPSGYSGPDSFSYTVSNGWDESTATVTLTVNDATPATYEFLKIMPVPISGNSMVFGRSVSLDGDYAIVGATGGETSPGVVVGTAHIYQRNQGGIDNWGQVVQLAASDGQLLDHFGWSVHIDGDYAIVGAGDQGSWSGIGAGAAYIFYRHQGGVNNWGEVAKLTASDAEADDLFGASVSLSGDNAIVGAYSEDTGGADAGAAYIFNRNQGGADNWGEVTKIMASDIEAGDIFGLSVTINADIAIVGAPSEDTAGFNAGAAYVYYRNQGGADNWGELRKITGTDAFDNFGNSVSLNGNEVIIGANQEYVGSVQGGAAHILHRDQGGIDNWGEIARITASDPKANDLFGSTVSLSGDYAIVGAKSEDIGGSNAGAAYLFHRNQGGVNNWGETLKFKASDAEAGDYFGSTVSISGNTAIVGAPWEDTAGNVAGAAYLYGW